MKNRRRVASLSCVGFVLSLFVFAPDVLADMAAYRTAVQATPGLVDHYDFEGTIDDSIDGGNGLNPTTAGSPPTFVAGVSGEGEAGDFDGASNAITIARPIQDNYTIMGWVLAPELQAGDGGDQFWMGSGVIYADVGGGADDFGVGINGEKLAHGIGNPDTTILSGGDVAGPLACGWVHFAAVRRVDGGSSALEIWLNGALSTQGTAPNINTLVASATLTIGANAVDGRFYRGALDEVSLLGVALDGATITSLYNTSGHTNDVSECPAPDARCDTLVVEGPAGSKIGIYTLTATGFDPSDPLLYTFKAESGDGSVILSAGPQSAETAAFDIQLAGEWTFSVLVDDLPCCPDGANATCTQVVPIEGYGLTDATGRLLGDAFLVLGPFQQPYGCNPGPRLLQNYIAPDRINCLYPVEGETINYDTAVAASTAYAGPVAGGGEPVWRALDDGTSYNGDQDLLGDAGATVKDDVMSWLVTYVEYRGAGSVAADICLGTDDSGLLYINRDLAIQSGACRGVSDCDARTTYTFAPGVYRLAAASFQGGGGWGLRMRLEVGGSAVLGDNPDWVFHGTTRPAGFVPPPCSICPAEPVRDLTCALGATRLDVSWVNPPTTDASTPTVIKVNGVEMRTVDSSATSVSFLKTLLPPAGTQYVVEVIHCGGIGATCSPYATNDLGQILTQQFLVLGPFSHTHGCGGATTPLERNHIAPSHIACQYPVKGNEVDYDPLDPDSGSTGYAGPTGPNSKPIWRQFNDGTATDGDQDLTGDVGGPLDDVMSWLATYVEYRGTQPKNIRICVGSDDGGQLWLNDRLLLTRNQCTGRSDCQYSVNATIQPGHFRLALAAWNAGGGWGGMLSLYDADTDQPIIDSGLASDWKFHGTKKPAVEFGCTLAEPVLITSCVRDEAGDVHLTWDHQQVVDALTITADGITVMQLPGDARSIDIPGGELPQADPLRLCVENGAQPPACCFVAPFPECISRYSFDGHTEDELGANSGTFMGGAELEPVFTGGHDDTPSGAILLDGIDDQVVITRSIGMEFTIAFWVQSELPQAGGVADQFWSGTGLIYADLPGGANDFGTAITGDVFAFGIGNPDETVHSTTPVVGPGVGWKHVAATRAINAALGVSILRVYVDGLLENELQHLNTSPLDATATITIGGNAVDGRFFSGAIDDVYLCNYPLSDVEIETLYFGESAEPKFHRGDADNSNTLQLTDAIRILLYLFVGGLPLTCLDAGDADDSGQLNLTDAIRVLQFLFLGGSPPPLPGPPGSVCGPDPTDDGLGCAEYPPCS